MLAAGCGTTVARVQPSQGTLAAAVTKTGTQSVRIAVTLAAKSHVPASFAITGAFDFARSRGTLTMRAPIGLTELFVPPKAFVKFTGAGASGMPLPRGKTWVEFDAASSFGPFAVDTNPGDLLASLTAIAGSVRKLGTGTVRGVPVTEYQVNIDPAKAAAKVPSGRRASFSQMFQSLGKAAIPVDVWVDGQNLVRQFQLSLPQLTVTIDFYDFGVPVKVSAPPAAQVANLSQIANGGSISAGSGSGSSSPPVGAPSPPPLP
jgi:hypothetical protein